MLQKEILICTFPFIYSCVQEQLPNKMFTFSFISQGNYLREFFLGDGDVVKEIVLYNKVIFESRVYVMNE